MNFGSDNMAPAAPEILAALSATNAGMAAAYGTDDVTKRLEAQFSALFETRVQVFPMITGGAANSISLAALTRPWSAVYCHAESHVNTDECGGPEFYTDGAKLIPLPGDGAKIAPETLAEALKTAWIGSVHSVQPAALSLTQQSECGTVYAPDEVAALTKIARDYAMAVHMDGARFANAVAHLGCAPADITWRAGVDLLSFGATKNGALGAEAIIAFRDGLAEEIEFRRKRAGHLLSKMRFVSAQLEAYIADGLWLRLAGQANAMASRLSDGLAALPGIKRPWPTQGNEVFVTMPEALIQALLAEGAIFYRWGDRNASRTVRMVAGWHTSAAEVDALIEAAARHLNAAEKKRA
ncbi:MAG TPA: low specificity L-threonine aldolase [Alphaproteobacteria bacterium]|nr:low specificity L-threonine aldolase [Alphaproteobacteria bacterium]